MSVVDSKKNKRRKTKKAAVTKAASSASPSKMDQLLDPPTSMHSELNIEMMRKLEKLMDADDETALKMLSLSRGTNPFLDRERCLLCNCEREDPPEAEAIRAESTLKQTSPMTQGSCLQFPPLWVCPVCRKAADQEMDKKQVPIFDPEADAFLPDISIKSGSEPTTPNGSICNCEACTERRMIETEHEQETAELQQCWTELRKIVRRLYSTRDDSAKTEDFNINDVPITDLVHKLCSRDPHQLFLRLESQVREFVIEVKVKLLKQLSTGFKTPPQAKKFISLMLDEYTHLCRVARKMSGLLKELQNHLKRFKVTWDLHNKFMFQSVVFAEQSVKNSLNLLIQQLRVGVDAKETYHDDSYPNLLHRFLKFEDEMSVINVVWRDCHQLIETYNEEQSALKLKQKMLREDWEFFKSQRKLLEQSVSKNPKASLSHTLEAQFTETMRLMLQGNKPSQDELTCPRCNRKRCPCDECTITHMITCGIINPEVLDSANAPNPLTSHHNANFMHDPNRYRIDVSPPSMSSTTSSSGSSSPVILEPDQLNRPFRETDNQNEDEIQEEIEENHSFDDDEDDDEDDDDDDDEDNGDEGDGDDEADNEQISAPKLESFHLPAIPALKDMMMPSLDGVGEETLRRALLGKMESCNCDHCVAQAKLEQLKPEENQCQCHVCLQQQGKALSTSLPQSIAPIVPRPGELHLYPHIHGSTGLHTLGRGPVPNLYDLHFPTSSKRQRSIIHSNKMSKLDFDSEGMVDPSYAYGEWDNPPYDRRFMLPDRLTGKFDSELLPPPPFTSSFLSEPLSLPGMLSSSSSSGISTAANTNGFVSSFSGHSVAPPSSSSAVKITDNLSVLSTKESLGEQLANAAKHNHCGGPGTGGQNHAPQCSRPATLGGNNTPKVQEKVHSQHCRKHNSQGANKNGPLQQGHPGKAPPDGRTLPQQLAGLKPGAHPTVCSHLAASNTAKNVANQLGTLVHQGHGTNVSCNNGLHLPSNNVSVGTSTCVESDCDGISNHDNDSYDDNCSEKSSSTSNSNTQKDGKYCDCCYCEFFGHGNPPMAPTSRNYAEMRDKLRLRLKKKTETSSRMPDDTTLPTRCTGQLMQQRSLQQASMACRAPPISVSPAPCLDPLETKGLEELIKFINGTEGEEDKGPISAKAAKRARQKQRKAEEKARQDAEERKKEERQRELRLRQLEEERRLVEEAERQKKEAAARKQKKPGPERGGKSSSKSPSPPSAGPGTPGEGTGDGSREKNKQIQKKGKHKDEQPPLQVNITYEIESTSNTPVSTATQSSRTPNLVSSNLVVSGGSTASESVIITAVCMSASSTAPRPATTGGKANNTPPSIDNRLILTAKHNKNRQPPVNQFHVGNGDMSPAAALTAVTAEVTASNNHIAKITLQQQELLKKQTQQLIQLKVQQELKKQQQQQLLQQQQQQQQQVKLQQQNKQSQQQQQQRPPPPPAAAASQKPDGAKKPADNINAEQNNVNHVNAKNALNAKPNVKINNSKGTASVPLRTEPVVNLNNRAAPTKAPTHVGDGSMQKSAAQPQQDQSQSASKGKATTIRKPEDNLNHQYQPTPPQLLRNGQLATAHQSAPAASTPGRPHSQQNGFIGQGLPAKGQVRQPPQGQAAHNGDARATTPEERGKGKQQQESPPSDQGKGSGGKSKKTKRKNKSTGDDKFIDECFMPKSESDIEGGEMDEFERELEEFKRFCVDSTPAKREKLQVNINIKDIFSKKKPGLCN